MSLFAHVALGVIAVLALARCLALEKTVTKLRRRNANLKRIVRQYEP